MSKRVLPEAFDGLDIASIVDEAKREFDDGASTNLVCYTLNPSQAGMSGCDQCLVTALLPAKICYKYNHYRIIGMLQEIIAEEILLGDRNE